MAIDRIKLTVKEVSEPKQVGNKGAQKLQFKAATPDNKELIYFTFSTRLFEYIKPGTIIDSEVDTTTREYEGKSYTDRKVTQIYVDGQPVGGQRQGGGWEKRDNTASIEAQTAYKGIMELAAKHETPNHISGKFAEAFDLALDWAISKLKAKPVPAAETSPEKLKAETKPLKTEKPAEGKSYVDDLENMKFDNPGEFYTACYKYLRMMKKQVEVIIEGMDLKEPEQRRQAWIKVINKQSEV